MVDKMSKWIFYDEDWRENEGGGEWSFSSEIGGNRERLLV